MSAPDHPRDDTRDEGVSPAAALPNGVLAVRRGPGANCSSIGSAIEILFALTVVGSALYAGIASALDDATSKEEAKTARAADEPPKAHRGDS